MESRLPGNLCKSAETGCSVEELCRRPSHDSDKLYGLSRMLPDRSRLPSDDDVDDCPACCGDAYGDGLLVTGNMTVGDELALGSLRRVDSRLMNDVLCLNRWHDDALYTSFKPSTHLCCISACLTFTDDKEAIILHADLLHHFDSFFVAR